MNPLYYSIGQSQTIEAVLIQAADAISASRPGARRETLETYIKRLESLEQIADSFEGVEKSFAIQAGREISIIVKPEKISDDQMVLTARDIAKQERPQGLKDNLKVAKRGGDVSKIARESYVKEVANKWKDQIDPRVYEALMNYQVEITD